MSIRTSNITAGFIDLATYNDIEKQMYGDKKNFPSTYEGEWGAQVPVELQLTPGEKNSFLIHNGGDKLLYTWIDITIPKFELKESNRFGEYGRLRWTKNLAHNIFETIDIKFGKKTFQSLSSYALDFLAHYTIGKDKLDAYNHSIGNREVLVSNQQTFETTTLCLPVPAFFSKSLEKALVTNFPYGVKEEEQDEEIKQKKFGRIKCYLRSWNQLLTLTNIETGENVIPRLDELTNTPTFSIQVYMNYELCSGWERRERGKHSHKMVFEQFQTATYPIKRDEWGRFPCYAKCKGPIKVLLFATRNKKNPNEWSNYTLNGKDPLKSFTIMYEGTQRLISKPEHTSFIFPFFHADTVPKPAGIHMYSYAFGKMGDSKSFPSTNYDELSNVKFYPEYDKAEDIDDCEFVVVAISKNILKIKDGFISTEL